MGAAVFRVAGTGDLEAHLAALAPITLIATSLGDATVCLLAVERDRVRALGELARELAVRGVVTRVEAEPHL